MSAPPPGGPGRQPPGLPAGQPRPKPNANPMRPMRPMRRRPADPLVSRKPNVGSRPQTPAGSIGGPMGGPSLGLNPLGQAATLAELDQRRKQFGGWSEPPPNADFRDFPIVTTAKALKEGIRHHIMRFSQSKKRGESKPIDPLDQELFTRPVTLHRRDPRQPPAGRPVPAEDEVMVDVKPIDDKEAERQKQLKAERDAQKAIDQAKIAPSIAREGNVKKPKKERQEKITPNYMPKTEKGIKEAEIRYEEALPWHLEDVDGKNVWAGSYVAALSETHVAFVIDGPKFRMVPLEKWYKFTAKPTFDKIPDDKIEEYMRKDAPKIGRWMMQGLEKQKEEQKMKEEFRNHGKRRARGSAGNPAAEVRQYDEVDMEGDEFDDDDENPGFDHEDEDTKIANERVRANMLGANLFGEADENEVDAEEEARRRREKERRQATKKLKKTFIKRDDANDIESEDDSLFSGDPFAETSSEDEDDEEEDANVKLEEEDKAKNDRGQAAFGANSKGNTTPSGKRQVDVLKGNKLKRAGSPNLSESSGNESTLRKRVKKKGDAAGHSRSTTPMPQGQSLGSQRRRVTGGFTSDGEVTAGEMSDGRPRKKKIKLIPSARGTPAGSRAGSPLPTTGQGSAAASPTRDGRPAPSGAIEAWEIVQALPPLPKGIGIGEFLKLFDGRVGEKSEGKMPKSEWIKLVKENCNYGVDKQLRRKS